MNPWHSSSPAKRPTATADPAPKRTRQDGQSQFLSPEHRRLLRRYVVNVATMVADRERCNFDITALPDAVDYILDGVAYMIGELWEECVRLSKMRIDATMHQLAGDVVVDDVDAALEHFKNIDLKEREETNPANAGSMSEGEQPSTVVESVPGGQRAGGPPVLFENVHDEKQRAKEAAMVRMKQAELTREVNVQYMLAALELSTDGGSAPLIRISPRARMMFTSGCAFFYENFVDRVLVNFIQQRQRQPSARHS